MSSILYWHPVLAVTLLCLITMLISFAGLKLVRRYFPENVLRDNHEVGGFIFNAFGLIYAVLVAFVVFATWTEYDNSKKNVDLESIELTDIYNNSKAMPEELKQQANLLMKTYAEDVVNDEWSKLEDGLISDKAENSFKKMWEFYITTDVNKLNNEPAYSETLKHLNDALEHRRMRIFDANNNIPGIIWSVLLFGAFVNLIYTYFFFAKNIKHQLMMSSALTILNTLILYMIFLLDNPFRGYMKVDAKPFEYFIQLVNSGM